MELNLSKKVITINYDGKKYSLRVPSNRELKAFIDSDVEDFEKTIKLLDTCGLPEDIGWELDAESLSTIVDELTPKKKS